MSMTLHENKTKAVVDYIKNTWSILRRTEEHVLQLLIDPKLPYNPGDKRVLYIPRKENLKEIQKKFAPFIPERVRGQIEIHHLPRSFSHIQTHGLLYLPNAYIVPGGRFNEMYGWDSYFIVLGLLAENLTDWAFEMANNLLYEVEHYGKVLNANRTYYLTRSNPPFLTQTVLAVYRVIKDKTWLKQSLPTLLKFYHFWMKPPHYVKKTKLSRYYAEAATPAPEVSPTYYTAVKAYYRTQKIYAYDVEKYYGEKNDELKPAFYRADRAVRESGFDLSNQHGPFGADITECVSLSLNSLLYQMEQDFFEIYNFLDQVDEAKKWQEKAQERAQLISHYMWDHATGYFFSYNFQRNTIRPYVYATTFYPLFTGLATPSQAERILSNLPTFETGGGILTSAYNTGMQWDAPFGWAPFQYIAVEGLKRYGYEQDAKRIAGKFINLVNHTFAKHGNIAEKFDIRAGDTLLQNSIFYGYKTNEIGFGWTNAVYMHFLNNFDFKKENFTEKRKGD